MGFYGNIYQQIGNAILNFLISNNGKNNNSFLSNLEDSARMEGQTISFNTGNKWIQLSNSEDGCNIWHSPVKASDSDVQVKSEIIEQTGEEDGQLIAGVSCLLTPVFTYDEAGHITSSSSMQYSMSNKFPEGIKIPSNLEDENSIEITKLEDENTLVISFTE